jgi:hypothetical protein
MEEVCIASTSLSDRWRKAQELNGSRDAMAWREAPGREEALLYRARSLMAKTPRNEEVLLCGILS